MGLLDDLGYRSRPPGAVRGRLLALASVRPVSALLSRVLRPLDGVAIRVSGGRATLSGLLGGQPVVWLGVRGRRSGLLRHVPLNGIPYDEDLAVIGSSFGSRAHPQWALNLEADPSAFLTYRRRTVPALARRAGPTEEEEIWRAAAIIYPGYDRYRERVDREIKVFVLGRVPSDL
ncbi:MAG: nitroreductase family deazaflavin-dependent oxidoreductase [Actinobacteria bacterium]|nr:nitroreductase family deazaflavin-dependent oxidoreductase [Actinomycetota bacterium]